MQNNNHLELLPRRKWDVKPQVIELEVNEVPNHYGWTISLICCAIVAAILMFGHS